MFALTAGVLPRQSAVPSPSTRVTTVTQTRNTNVLDTQPTTTVQTSSTTTTTDAPRRRWTASDFAELRPAPDRYWDRVAVCETRSNWQNGGRFAGGLGIAVTTWKNYGGHQFASHPSRATREQQIEIANRISMFGFQTKNVFLSEADIPNRPFFRPPVGFGGWGCISQNDYLSPPVPGPWEQRRQR